MDQVSPSLQPNKEKYTRSKVTQCNSCSKKLWKQFHWKVNLISNYLKGEWDLANFIVFQLFSAGFIHHSSESQLQEELQRKILLMTWTPEISIINALKSFKSIEINLKTKPETSPRKIKKSLTLWTCLRWEKSSVMQFYRSNSVPD